MNHVKGTLGLLAVLGFMLAMLVINTGTPVYADELSPTPTPTASTNGGGGGEHYGG